MFFAGLYGKSFLEIIKTSPCFAPAQIHVIYTFNPYLYHEMYENVNSALQGKNDEGEVRRIPIREVAATASIEK